MKKGWAVIDADLLPVPGFTTSSSLAAQGQRAEWSRKVNDQPSPCLATRRRSVPLPGLLFHVDTFKLLDQLRRPWPFLK